MEQFSLKLPDTLKDQAEEAAEEKGYMNTSEYARAAIREKTEADLVIVRDDEEMIPVEDINEMLREQAAISLLESKVEEEGIPEVWEPGETWKPVLEEIREELVETDLISDDVSLEKIYEYTQERREELVQEYGGGT